MNLSSLVPDPEDLLGRKMEDLACPLLRVIESLPQGQRHRYNYLLSDAAAGYPPDFHTKIKEVMNWAWEWLSSQGYIALRPDSNQPEFIEITRKGRDFLKNCQSDGLPSDRPERQPAQGEKTVLHEAGRAEVSPGQGNGKESAPRPDRRPSLRMLSDAPLADDEDDRLDFKPYADAIAGLIDSPNTSTPLTLAINGPWGAGKTTLGLMIRRRLQQKAAAGGNWPHVTCWFNAWMHDDAPNLASAIAAEVARTADMHRPLWRRLLRPLPEQAGPLQRAVQRVLLLFDAILLLITVAELLHPPFGIALLEFLNVGPKLLSVLATVMPQSAAWLTGMLIAAMVLLAKASLATVPMAKSLSEFVRDPRAAATAVGVARVRSQLGDLIRQGTPRGSRFVVFVDDLERCKPPRSIEILDTVSQLLDQHGVVTVLLADMPVLAACVEIKYKDIARRHEAGRSPGSPAGPSGYGRAYLQKIVQLQFDLPSYRPEAVEQLVRHLASVRPFESGLPSGTGMLRRLRFLLGRIRPTYWPRSLRFVAGTIGPGFLLIVVAIVSYKLTRRPVGGLFGVAAFVLVMTVTAYIAREQAIARARRTVDGEIRRQVRIRGNDFSKVELAVNESLARLKIPLPPDPHHPGAFRPRRLGGVALPPSREEAKRMAMEQAEQVRRLVRERVQRYLEEESEFQRQAEEEIMKYLQPLPRHAKRLLNHLRLLLFVAHERRMFGGAPELTPGHVGKWTVLCERWPDLAQMISVRPALMWDLENWFGPEGPGAVEAGRMLEQLVPGYASDAHLRHFCGSGARLGPVIERIVHLEPALESPTERRH